MGGEGGGAGAGPSGLQPPAAMPSGATGSTRQWRGRRRAPTLVRLCSWAVCCREAVALRGPCTVSTLTATVVWQYLASQTCRGGEGAWGHRERGWAGLREGGRRARVVWNTGGRH